MNTFIIIRLESYLIFEEDPNYPSIFACLHWTNDQEFASCHLLVDLSIGLIFESFELQAVHHFQYDVDLVDSSQN